MGKRIGVVMFVALIAWLAISLVGADKTLKDATVQVGDIKMHYIEGGAGDRTLVFIPDLAMPAEIWKEQIPYFAARGFRVIALDPRSQGLTSKTDGGNTYHQHAADLHAFLEKLKLEHCTLVGWSAAVVTLLEYLSSPESLKPDRLVFVGGGPISPGDKEFPGGFTIQQARDLMLAMEDDRPKATEALVRGLFKSQQNGTIYKDIGDGSLKTPTGTAVALLFDLITGDRKSALTVIDVPTLIVVSQDKRLLGEYLQSKITGAQLKIIPDSGPAVFLEKPQAFNQALEEFLGVQ
jgi:microsomal epoxide hydrolase